MVSNQERRAAVFPVITADKQRVNRWLSSSICSDFLCSSFRENVQDNCPRCPGGQAGRLCPGRIDLSASGPARSRPAPPPRIAPPRTDPPVVCPCFGFDMLFSGLRSGRVPDFRTRQFIVYENVFFMPLVVGLLFS